MVLACLAGQGLAVSWLLVSTLGDNNDLGLRAFIPAVMVLIVGAAARSEVWPAPACAPSSPRLALTGLVLSRPTPLTMFRDNAVGLARPGGSRVRAIAAVMGGRAPLCAARRPDCQQSAVRQGRDAVARSTYPGRCSLTGVPALPALIWRWLSRQLPSNAARRSAHSFFACSGVKPRPDDVHDHGGEIWLRRRRGSADR